MKRIITAVILTMSLMAISVVPVGATNFKWNVQKESIDVIDRLLEMDKTMIERFRHVEDNHRYKYRQPRDYLDYCVVTPGINMVDCMDCVYAMLRMHPEDVNKYCRDADSGSSDDYRVGRDTWNKAHDDYWKEHERLRTKYITLEDSFFDRYGKDE